MKLIIETRNGFYDGWLAEILGLQLPQALDDQGVESGRQTAAESGEPCVLLQALRLELSQGVRNVSATYLPEGKLVDELLRVIEKAPRLIE
jgi:hypothetical protein